MPANAIGRCIENIVEYTKSQMLRVISYSNRVIVWKICYLVAERSDIPRISDFMVFSGFSSNNKIFYKSLF